MSSQQHNTPTPRTMIALDQPGTRFGLRAAGIAIHDGHVLLQRTAEADFWFLPGGRCELLETSRDTVRREMYEELGVNVRVERLLWVLENFFTENHVACHELGLYFLIDLGPKFAHYAPDKPFERDEDGRTLFFRWFPIDDLCDLRLYPTFMRHALVDLPKHTEHIIHRDA